MLPQKTFSDSGVTIVFNRLKKNRRRLKAWLQRSGTDCYRIYDADIPEYAAAIDVYGEWVHFQEYAPPKTVDPAVAGKHLAELVEATAQFLNIGRDRIVFKQRKRQHGPEQYQRLGSLASMIKVREVAATFLVNLHDYLDTGLFLDSRPLRRALAERSFGKRILNLFCYTATATVQAVLGGATHSLSIDLSPTYIAWAGENFKLNGVDLHNHQLVQTDVVSWLAQPQTHKEQYDLIYLDPPTFSNSKRTKTVLDLARDYPRILAFCHTLLADDGALLFCTNNRRFQLDQAVLPAWSISRVGSKGLDPDFARDPKIHQAWWLTKR